MGRSTNPYCLQAYFWTDQLFRSSRRNPSICAPDLDARLHFCNTHGRPKPIQLCFSARCRRDQREWPVILRYGFGAYCCWWLTPLPPEKLGGAVDGKQHRGGGLRNFEPCSDWLHVLSSQCISIFGWSSEVVWGSQSWGFVKWGQRWRLPWTRVLGPGGLRK